MVSKSNSFAWSRAERIGSGSYAVPDEPADAGESLACVLFEAARREARAQTRLTCAIANTRSYVLSSETETTGTA